MSLQEQIDAAWKAETPKVREALQCSRASQVLGAAEVGFAAGYRAMAKRLYREVKPEERLANLGRVVWDHEEVILSALSVVEGLEAILPCGPWMEECVKGKIEIRLSIKGQVRYVYGDTLSAAVAAAVEAVKKGGE